MHRVLTLGEWPKLLQGISYVCRSVLGPPLQERGGHTRESLVKDPEGGKGPEHLSCKEAIQPGKERLRQVSPMCLAPGGGWRRQGQALPSSAMTRGNVDRLKCRRLHLIGRRKTFILFYFLISGDIMMDTRLSNLLKVTWSIGLCAGGQVV